MNYADINQRRYIDFFLNEMASGLAGKAPSSLKMLPTFIHYSGSIDTKKQVIVLDAGGTNLRSAVVSFNKDFKPCIRNLSAADMPGAKEEVSKEEFFDVIAENISSILHFSNSIGFVFSYPIEIFPDKDGKLIRFTKEIKAAQVEGEFIGRNLISAIERKNHKSGHKIVLLNDTVATLLSGIAAYQQRLYDSYAGLVLGTGMNVCYMEKNSNILKIKSYEKDHADKLQLINVEAGNFSKGPAGEVDKIFDKKTLNPGTGTFEKMFSGAYMGSLATELLKTAAKQKLFSRAACRLIKDMKTLFSKDIDIYLNYPPLQGSMAAYIKKIDENDRIKIYFLFDNLIERAAILTSIVLSALIIKTGKGYNPCSPVCIVAEGSSFYKMNNFKSRVEHYLRLAIGKDRIKVKGMPERFYEINRVENAVILGAAIAANII
ncbi:MAG: hexokinase [Actinobacteria bacterium]|nr:hexokinase [Actinomycetota bacterium]